MKTYFDRMDLLIENLFKQNKVLMSIIARLCLISTFLEDSFRIRSQWGPTRDSISFLLGCGTTLPELILLIILFGQFIPCALILARKFVNFSVYFLFVVLLLQTYVKSVMSGIFWDYDILLRNVSVSGGLIFLLVENQPDAKSYFAGLPVLENTYEKPKSLLQLIGRVILVVMFLALIKLELTILNILYNTCALVLVGLVAIGYKTKLSSLTLIGLLAVHNFFAYPFWLHSYPSAYHDAYKYAFFQTLSVVGGLLFIVILGPGDVSYDQMKKKW